MRFRLLALVALVVPVGLTACGGGDSDKGSSAQAPASAAQRGAVAELRYCVEGAGADTAKPGQSIPAIGAPSGPDVPDASRALVIYWPDTKDVAHVYYAASEAAAEDAARGLGADAKQKGNLVIVPDSDHPPTPDDEGLLLDDCLL